MKKLIFILTILFITLEAREVIDDTGICKINWTQGYITCEGESAQGQSSRAAKVSAKVIAQRNLLEVVKGVRIDSMVTVQDGMFSSDIIKSRVSGIVRGGQILSNKYDHTLKNAVATIKLRMGKGLLSALLSDPTKLSWNEQVQKLWDSFSIITNANAATYTHQDKKTIQKILEDLRQVGDKKGEEYLQSVLNNLNTTTYSGILIDVSEIEDFEKAMIVKLVDESGKEIYPAKIVSRRTLLKRNTSVGYMYGLDDARKNQRIFSTPMEIKATQVYKRRKSNIVLSKEQLESIATLDKNVLKNAKIILVLGD